MSSKAGTGPKTKLWVLSTSRHKQKGNLKRRLKKKEEAQKGQDFKSGEKSPVTNRAGASKKTKILKCPWD